MTWALVFVASLLIDILYVSWTNGVQEGKPFKTACVSALIQVVGLGAILLVVDDRALIVASVLGHAVGSYIGISWAMRKKPKDELPTARVLDRD